MSQPALGLRKMQIFLSQSSIEKLIDDLLKGERNIIVVGGDENNYATRLTITPEKGARYS
jgi:hypothetical protein